jgi:hypothetical protein
MGVKLGLNIGERTQTGGVPEQVAEEDSWRRRK